MCRTSAYSRSIIIKLADSDVPELFYRQPASVDLADSARVANPLRQILYLLGPSALSCNCINIMRKGSLSYALEEAFKIWEGKFTHPLLLRMETGHHVLHVVEGENTGSQLPSHHPQPWMDLVFRLRGQTLVLGKVSNTLHCDLLISS